MVGGQLSGVGSLFPPLHVLGLSQAVRLTHKYLDLLSQPLPSSQNKTMQSASSIDLFPKDVFVAFNAV